MKVLVTGVTGQLGYDCIRELEKRGIACRGVASRDFSLTDRAAARQYIMDYRPDVILHCAAYTAVDQAEEDAEMCEAVNAEGTRNLAELCRELDAKMIYISTDYVFPGDGTKFYEPDDPKAPQNVYGCSKLHGEKAVQSLLDKYFIVRISWVFGSNGRNFIRTMLTLGKTHDTVKVVDDQVGSPTYTRDLAVLLTDMAASDRYGVYHATNEGVCSWAEFAAEIFCQAGMRVQVIPVPSTAYPTKAVRPKNSRMSKYCLEKGGFSRLPGWQDAVGRYLTEIGIV